MDKPTKKFILKHFDYITFKMTLIGAAIDMDNYEYAIEASDDIVAELKLMQGNLGKCKETINEND